MDKGEEQAKASSNYGVETFPQPGIKTPQGSFYGPLFVSKLGVSSQGVASYIEDELRAVNKPPPLKMWPSSLQI